MTNIIKQTLLDKVTEITNSIIKLSTEIDMLRIANARDLLDLPNEVGVISHYGDSLAIYLDGKEILSINDRSYGKPYLNTYTTMVDSAFEFQRLVTNGRIAEKFLNDSELFSKLFEKTELDVEIEELRSQRYKLNDEIFAIEREEAEALKTKKLADMLDGQEVVFDKPTTITVGAGRYNHVQRVVSFKIVNKNKSGKKVDVEFTCLKWGQGWGGETQVAHQSNIQVKYLENKI